MIRFIATHKLLSAGALAILVAGAGTLVFVSIENTQPSVTFSTAQRGPFTVEIKVSGEIVAQDRVIIYGPTDVRSDLALADIIPEGTMVHEGDYIAQFSTTALENQLDQQRQTLDKQFSELRDLARELLNDSLTREANLKIKMLSFEQKKIGNLLAKFKSENERLTAEIDMQVAEYNLNRAIREKEKDDKDDASELQRKKDTITKTQETLNDIQKQIAACTLTAPVDGILVYKKTRGQDGVERPVRPGDSVFRRQELFEIPNLDSLNVNVTINERDISSLRVGMDVRVWIDAVGREYFATVKSIAPIGRRETLDVTNRVKVFDTVISLKNREPNDKLRPGMSADCFIVLDHIPDAIYIPRQALFIEGAASYVYAGNAFKKQHITTGRQNSDFIIVTSGLNAGDKVALRNPEEELQTIGAKKK